MPIVGSDVADRSRSLADEPRGPVPCGAVHAHQGLRRTMATRPTVLSLAADLAAGRITKPRACRSGARADHRPVRRATVLQDRRPAAHVARADDRKPHTRYYSTFGGVVAWI
jgi:hypothetical protein